MRRTLVALALAIVCLAGCRMSTAPELATDRATAVREAVADPTEPQAPNEIPHLVAHGAFKSGDDLVFFGIMDGRYDKPGYTWQMLLYLDTDSDPKTGTSTELVKGYERFVLSGVDHTYGLYFCIFSFDFPFPTCSGITYRQHGRVITLRVPLSYLSHDDGRVNYTAVLGGRYYSGRSIVLPWGVTEEPAIAALGRDPERD